MPWGRVDDSHYRHPKLLELDDDLRKGCIALYWLAISWCNDHLTDGRVPPGTVRLLGGSTDEAAELVRVGLWEARTKGFAVHDYLDFNKSREQVEADRAQRTEAGKLGAAARWHGGSPSDSSSGSPSKSPSKSTSEMDAPYPVPRTPVSPDPIDARATEWDDGRADLEAFVLLTRRAPTPRQRQLLDGLLDRHDLTGPQWASDIMLRHPDDPIGAVIAADKEWRAERIAEAQAAERPKPKPHRPRGLPESTREILEHWAAAAKESA